MCIARRHMRIDDQCMHSIHGAVIQIEETGGLVEWSVEIE
jgi:hypothetical protein